MKNNNQINVPLISRGHGPLQDAYQASEVGVNLWGGYNASLTSREAGSVGGQMVKNMCPGRIAKFDRNCRISTGHVHTAEYITAII